MKEEPRVTTPVQSAPSPPNHHHHNQSSRHENDSGAEQPEQNDADADGDDDDSDNEQNSEPSYQPSLHHHSSKSNRHSSRRSQHHHAHHQSRISDVTTQTATGGGVDKTQMLSLPVSYMPMHSNHETVMDTETQINLLKIQEYECKIKESQMRCDQQRIEILKSQEELEHLKEINRLKIREMQLKISNLEEQSKLRRNRV